MTNPDFFQVFPKNSPINKFEEEKPFDSGTLIFLGNSTNWVYFGQGEDLIIELSEKVQYSRNQAIENSLNETILLMSINEDLF